MFLVAMLFATFVGCASPPIRSDYPQDQPPLKEGSYLDKVWFEEGALSADRYSEIRLELVRSIGVSDQTNITVAQAIQWLRQATIQPGTDSLVLRSTGPGKAANLELVITELNPGSTAARFWAGEFGAGHAWVQVEGKLTDTNSHKLLGYFVERDRKSGVATFRNSRGEDSGPGLIHDIIEDIGKKVRREIGAVLHIQG
jgi:hypothetical protein